jgi:hypothetical protein
VRKKVRLALGSFQSMQRINNQNQRLSDLGHDFVIAVGKGCLPIAMHALGSDFAYSTS